MSAFPFGMTRGMAISVMLGFSIEVQETDEGPGCWMINFFEIIRFNGVVVVAPVVEWIGGETEYGRRYFADESLACTLIEGHLGKSSEFPPGRN